MEASNEDFALTGFLEQLSMRGSKETPRKQSRIVESKGGF